MSERTGHSYSHSAIAAPPHVQPDAEPKKPSLWKAFKAVLLASFAAFGVIKAYKYVDNRWFRLIGEQPWVSHLKTGTVLDKIITDSTLAVATGAYVGYKAYKSDTLPYETILEAETQRDGKKFVTKVTENKNLDNANGAQQTKSR